MALFEPSGVEDQGRQTHVTFLVTEVNAGLMFVARARAATDPVLRARSRTYAERAHASVLRSMGLLPLTAAERAALVDGLGRLQAAIAGLAI
jgi:hypothetical protein